MCVRQLVGDDGDGVSAECVVVFTVAKVLGLQAERRGGDRKAAAGLMPVATSHTIIGQARRAIAQGEKLDHSGNVHGLARNLVSPRCERDGMALLEEEGLGGSAVERDVPDLHVGVVAATAALCVAVKEAHVAS